MAVQPLTEDIAFEIIVQHFSGQTLEGSQQEIQQRILNIHIEQGGLPECAVLNPVKRTLRYLKKFGLADHKHNSWHIKSVDDMDKRLRDLAPNELPELFNVHEMLSHKTELETELDHVVRDIEHIISHYRLMSKKRVLSMISKKLS